MDAGVQELFSKVAAGARSVAERLQDSQKESAEIVGVLANKLQEFASVLEAQVGVADSATAEPNADTSAGKEKMFLYLYELASSQGYKKGLLETKTWLMNHPDTLKALYDTARKGQ